MWWSILLGIAIGLIAYTTYIVIVTVVRNKKNKKLNNDIEN